MERLAIAIRVAKAIRTAKGPMTLQELAKKAGNSNRQSAVAGVVWRMVDAGQAAFVDDKRVVKVKR